MNKRKKKMWRIKSLEEKCGSKRQWNEGGEGETGNVKQNKRKSSGRAEKI